VLGMPKSGLGTVCDGLRAQNNSDGAGWDQLIFTSGGKNLRALNPTLGMELFPGLFSSYFDSYTERVWSKYTNEPLIVDTQAQWGTVVGRVSNGVLTFPGLASFTKPNSRDIFSCNTGQFSITSVGQGALVARISAAFNRSTLLTNPRQPCDPATNYQDPTTNHYSRIVHATNLDHRGYAFAFDDVQPNDGADQSGAVNDPNPSVLTVTVGEGTTGGGNTGGGNTGGGTGQGPSAYSTIRAESHTSQSGTQTEPCIEGGRDVAYIANGDWLEYGGVDFGSQGATQFKVRVASGASSGISGLVQVALDRPDAPPVGSFAIGNTGGWQSWTTIPANMSTVRGRHNVYLTFSSGQPRDYVNVSWFTFSS